MHSTRWRPLCQRGEDVPTAAAWGGGEGVSGLRPTHRDLCDQVTSMPEMPADARCRALPYDLHIA